jgi:dipeptidase D
MQKILDYFQQITQIPHCSHETSKLKDFLVTFSKERGYEVLVDSFQNILIKKGTPKLAFQAHYDMVCVGEAPKIETYIKDGWMMAKDSTLGADNGMAIAMMLSLMDEKVECEFLFTSDEEVGLIGASGLEFELEALQMLNLDSEDEAEVYIGCAGGVDIEAVKTYDSFLKSTEFYEITIGGLRGGHSGVEIHKNIPNAIKLFAQFLRGKDIQIASIKAGERINSIPVNLKATLFYDGELKSQKYIETKRVSGNFEVIEAKEVIEILDNFKDGVISFNDKLDVPNESINLALVSLEDGELKIQASARAMDDKGLENIQKDYEKYFKNFNMSVKCEGKYPAWKPEINEFSKEVEKAMIAVFGRSEFKAIHAGLECAIISKKYPNLKITSIGPNIRSPHSISEKVELASVFKTYEVIQEILKQR